MTEKRKYTNNKKLLLEKYHLSRINILMKKGVYLEDFDTWEEANKYSKHIIYSTINYKLKGKTEIYCALRVANAKSQRWIVKTTLEDFIDK